MSLYLLLFGIIIGRNWNAIYETTSEDTGKILRSISTSRGFITCYWMLESLFLSLDERIRNKVTVYAPHTILCECNRRSCKPLSINTYIRKIKAVN